MKKLIVLGAGESGVGAAILAKKKGFEVFVSENGKIKNKYNEVLINHEIGREEGGHTESKILDADLVVKSPGIPDNLLIIQKIKEKGIPVISEIEFASRYTNATIVGITGSNGKTTTTLLTYHILKNAGLHVGLAGNVGNSFAWQVAEHEYEYYVLELSSFQLDGIVDFHPHITVLLNITPDHLDRYENRFENYVHSKFSITKNQTGSDYFIYDEENKTIATYLNEHPMKVQKIAFSLNRIPENGIGIEDNNIVSNINKTEPIMSIQALSLEGNHNLKNAMAATAIAQILRIQKTSIRESLASFQGVEHRLEKVLKINHVMYINDSKATNVNSTYYALQSMTTPVVWIVGGTDKGNNYEELIPLVYEKVKAIVCLGIDNEKLIKTFGNIVPSMVETESMRDAVHVAYRLSERGDTVLLSPACASFDLFENYEDRGRQFKEAVRNL
ncbi:MAG TPA: UDP-N-acetylmuramoyl-L-alanine--D-glutamate ligase [Flavobacteriaceae bacterium]|nr:UDP-N-acetylmuramoyl-L-alanine--D-glutamate ligase [Flavobacteriaceae bacterium]